MNGTPPLPPIAPLPRDQRSIDLDQLNLLSIFHFVGGGLALLGILFLIVHGTIMHFMFTSPQMWQGQKGGPPPPEIFIFFIIFYVIFGLWFLACGILNILSGIFLRSRQNRTFSFIVAGINCIHFPLGTLLGVFTIMALSRESVRQLYEVR
jgi:uncharacterized membrane protein HdeD (DUF308 family)